MYLNREDRNQEHTIYVGDLDPQVNESLLWELFIQVAPVVSVHTPKDKLSGQHSGFGFVEFHSEEDAEYAVKIMNMIKLFGKPIRVNKSQRDKRFVDVGANLFVGNLSPEVDERVLYDTFSAFGTIIQTPKIMRDTDTGASKGFGFVSYDNFESSDMAVATMHGQFLCNQPINVMYAIKKETKGERHGSAAERLLAAQNPRMGRPAAPPPLFGGAPQHLGYGGGMGLRPPPGLAPIPPHMGMQPPPYPGGFGGAPPSAGPPPSLYHQPMGYGGPPPPMHGGGYGLPPQPPGMYGGMRQ